MRAPPSRRVVILDGNDGPSDGDPLRLSERPKEDNLPKCAHLQASGWSFWMGTIDAQNMAKNRGLPLWHERPRVRNRVTVAGTVGGKYGKMFASFCRIAPGVVRLHHEAAGEGRGCVTRPDRVPNRLAQNESKKTRSKT